MTDEASYPLCCSFPFLSLSHVDEVSSDIPVRDALTNSQFEG